MSWLAAGVAGALCVAACHPPAKQTTMHSIAVCGRIAIGLAGRSRAAAGATFRYRVAIANRSTAPMNLTLFDNMEGTIRTRAYLTDAAHGSRFVDAVFLSPSTAPTRIAIDLAPGQVHEQAGLPFTIPADASGAATLEVVYGGTKAAPCEVHSGPLAFTIEAPP